ncbi:hypothetical protein PCE1_003301 [Barthelona sp. PCE]
MSKKGNLHVFDDIEEAQSLPAYSLDISDVEIMSDESITFEEHYEAFEDSTMSSESHVSLSVSASTSAGTFSHPDIDCGPSHVLTPPPIDLSTIKEVNFSDTESLDILQTDCTDRSEFSKKSYKRKLKQIASASMVMTMASSGGFLPSLSQDSLPSPKNPPPISDLDVVTSELSDSDVWDSNFNGCNKNKRKFQEDFINQFLKVDRNKRKDRVKSAHVKEVKAAKSFLAKTNVASMYLSSFFIIAMILVVLYATTHGMANFLHTVHYRHHRHNNDYEVRFTTMHINNLTIDVGFLSYENVTYIYSYGPFDSSSQLGMYYEHFSEGDTIEMIDDANGGIEPLKYDFVSAMVSVTIGCSRVF